MGSAQVHGTAIVEPNADIGDDTRVWAYAHIRGGTLIGSQCVIGMGVYVGFGVCIGDSVKIQNNVSLFAGVTIEDGVFVGPHACFTNDKLPRAVNPDGQAKGASDWKVTPTLVQEGASIGANATIVCGVTIGKWAMVGAGAVVTRDVPSHGLVAGNPARLVGWVCSCGKRITHGEVGSGCSHG